FTYIARPRQLLLEHFPGIHLVEQSRLEIQTRRQPHVRMTRAGVTVNARMTASPVRVDGLLEGDVGRIITADHRASFVGFERGGDGVGWVLHEPTVVDRLDLLTLEAASRVRKGSAALETVTSWIFSAHQKTVQPYRSCMQIQVAPLVRG